MSVYSNRLPGFTRVARSRPHFPYTCTISAVTTEVAASAETLVSIYRTSRHHITRDGDLGGVSLSYVLCCHYKHRDWNYATSRKVSGSIPDGVIGIFHWHNPSGRIVVLGSTQPLTEMSTGSISLGWSRTVRRADNLNHLIVPIPPNSERLKLLGPSGPVQVWNGIGLWTISPCGILHRHTYKRSAGKRGRYSDGPGIESRWGGARFSAPV